MGITGELVRSVFSKSRSIGTHESTGKSGMVEKRRWSSVKQYLCGDEFNSVLAEEDSASVRSSEAILSQPALESVEAATTHPTPGSSEATVTQPFPNDLSETLDNRSDETKEETFEHEHQNSATELMFREEVAATAIQSAFKGFLARRLKGGIESMEGRQEVVAGKGSPSKESVGTSIEVQTGNSAEFFSIQEESTPVHHRLQPKARTQVFKLKQDWDDSTVSSSTSKMRIQHRLEATTRRERALAYAFSQQLRICSKKKQSRHISTEPNMGWSWLERWMATRLPETSSIENQTRRKLEPSNSNPRSVIRSKVFDVAKEERESCGSNEVSLQIDSISVSAARETDDPSPARNRLKSKRTVLRRKTVRRYHCKTEHGKVQSKTPKSV